MSIKKVLGFVILGPPGSGKGTISKWLCTDFQLEYVCTGNLLRNEIKNQTKNGLIAKDFIRKGELVSDNIVTKITLNELQKYIGKKSWLLDGYPRTLTQTLGLLEITNVNKVINLNVEEEEIVNRIKNRLIHPGSDRIYNNLYKPPKVPNRDDITGEPLIQREDDKEEAIRNRLKRYKEEMKDIKDHFMKYNILVDYSGKESKEIYAKILKDLKKNYY